MRTSAEIEELFGQACPRLMAEARASLPKEFIESHSSLHCLCLLPSLKLMNTKQGKEVTLEVIPLIVKYVADNSANWAARPALTGRLAAFASKFASKLTTVKKAWKWLHEVVKAPKFIAGVGCVLSVIAFGLEVKDLIKLLKELKALSAGMATCVSELEEELLSIQECVNTFVTGKVAFVEV